MNLSTEFFEDTKITYPVYNNILLEYHLIRRHFTENQNKRENLKYRSQ